MPVPGAAELANGRLLSPARPGQKTARDVDPCGRPDAPILRRLRPKVGHCDRSAAIRFRIGQNPTTCSPSQSASQSSKPPSVSARQDATCPRIPLPTSHAQAVIDPGFQPDRPAPPTAVQLHVADRRRIKCGCVSICPSRGAFLARSVRCWSSHRRWHAPRPSYSLTRPTPDRPQAPQFLRLCQCGQWVGGR